MKLDASQQAYGYIYCIENKLDGKKYIGKSSRSMGARWREHIKHAMLGKKSKLYEAMRTDGFVNFSFNIIEQKFCTSQELDDLEVLYIQKYDSHINGYNSDVGGTGRKRADRDITKISSIAGVSHGRKSVIGTCLSTGVETTYNSLNDAAKAVGGYGSKISNCARGTAKTAYGHTWRWIE
jgi:hypothetical protein